MSIFNLESQNKNIENKIVAGLERLSQVFRILLWDKAKEHSLSPIQIQILIFIQYHTSEKSTVSYLAQEFNLTKPTISDAVKVLEQKKLVKKIMDDTDSRSFKIELTTAGKEMVLSTENYVVPLTKLISKSSHSEKEILWQSILNLITQFNKMEIITVQRTCLNCKYFSFKNKNNFCTLLNQKLETKDLRIDCSEFVTNN